MASRELPSISKIGLFTGTFDPLTNGHLDIIKRAAQLFDVLYVGMFSNPEKQVLMTLEQRLSIITESVSAIPNVKIITPKQKLTTSIAQELGVTSLVRSIRNAEDLEYEKSLAWFNCELTGIETIFLLARPELQYLSSSHIKELLHYGIDISAYVPSVVLKELQSEH